MTGYVIRGKDGKYFEGSGYGGPGHRVPYWDEDIRNAKTYETYKNARKAAKNIGGNVGLVILDEWNRATNWICYVVTAGRASVRVYEDPADFEPNDYTGNNGPLGHDTGDPVWDAQKSDDVDGF